MDLKKLLKPETVAIVGASEKRVLGETPPAII